MDELLIITPERCLIMMGIILLATIQRTFQVYIQHHIPLVFGKFMCQPISANACIIKQDINFFQTPVQPFSQLLPMSSVNSYITGDCEAT